MAASKAQRAWDELNERQRTYLTVMYDEDQGLEEEQRHLGATMQWHKTPASVWRRMTLSGSYASVPRKLRSKKVWESGAGSTLTALSARGLIELGMSDTWMQYALLTRLGRATARAGLGIGPAARKEPWEVSEWLWRELAKVARAGPEGLPSAELFGSAHLYLSSGFAGERGNRPLLDEVRSFVRYFPRDNNGNVSPHWSSRSVHHFHFTELGRTYYAEHVAQYREWYPDIDAPDLVPVGVEEQAGGPGG